MTANTLLTISMISRDAAIVLGNTLDLAKRVNRDFDSDFGVKSAQIGQNINIRRPIRPTANVGSIIDVQAITETYSPLTFTDPYNTSYALTSSELTFSVEDYFDKVVEPSVQQLASFVEQQGQALLPWFYGLIGTPGTPLTGGASGTALPSINKALALLNKNDAPNQAGRKTLLNDPDFNGVLASSNLTYFNPGPEISKMYTSGYQGDYSAMRVFMNQLVQSHTNGVYGGTPVIATTVASNSTWGTTSTIATSGWTATTTSLNWGDVFTIAGVYMVNPQTKQALGTLQQFTVVNGYPGLYANGQQVVAPVSPMVTSGTGTSTITVSPAIVTTGGFQNVSQAPQAGAAIVVAGGSTVTTQNALSFDRDAIMLAAKELMPLSVGIGKSTTDDQTRIPIRVQQASDIKTNQEYLRFDIMVAWAPLYSQLAVRIATT
jgi:hypothetical protein